LCDASPRAAIIHHCANKVTKAAPRGEKRHTNFVCCGDHSNFPDLMVLCQSHALFFQLKLLKGRLSPAHEAFRDAVLAQGFGWALMRSLDDALGALVDHGFTSRVRLARWAAP
jgi:hypothetical protein